MTGLDAPRPKRVGPPDVPQVVLGALRFEVIHWGGERGLGQNGGYIAARDKDTGEERWILKIYDIAYDPVLESDVQDIFIEALAASGNRLLVTDERGRQYWVDPDTRTVRS